MNLIFQSYHAADDSAWDKKLDCYRPIDDLAALSIKQIKKYAESIGADYILLDKPYWSDIRKHPAWTRWAMFDYWDRYDNLCYIDCDILPTPHAFGRSIFDTEGTAKYTERDEGSRAAWHVNAGVFKVDKIQARKLSYNINGKKYIKMLEKMGKNQDAFNECWKKTFMRKPKHFGTSWNATRPYHRTKPYYLHHYIGAQKTERGNQFGNLHSNGVYEWNLKET